MSCEISIYHLSQLYVCWGQTRCSGMMMTEVDDEEIGWGTRDGCKKSKTDKKRVKYSIINWPHKSEILIYHPRRMTNADMRNFWENLPNFIVSLACHYHHFIPLKMSLWFVVFLFMCISVAFLPPCRNIVPKITVNNQQHGLKF